MSTGLGKKNILAITAGAILIVFSILVVGTLDSITLAQPSDSAEISGTYNLRATVSQHATSVNFYWSDDGGASWNLITTVNNDSYPDIEFTYGWDTTTVDDGLYTINATATNGTVAISDNSTGVSVNNIVIPTPTNFQVADILDDQGSWLNLSWTWDGNYDILDTFTIIEINSSFEANTSYPYYYASGLDNYLTYCYIVRAVGTSGDVSGWTDARCAEPNAEPLMDLVDITPDNPTKLDTVQCVGFMHDLDWEGQPLSANYLLSAIRLSNQTISHFGTVECVPIIPGQWPGVDPPGDATHECVVTIPDIEKGDKWTCQMEPYDQEEYGPWGYSSTVYINNSRPTALDVHIEPEDANYSSTLNCSYTFFDHDYGDSENVSEALFMWYKNIDGMNDWILLEGQTGRTLENTDEKTWFSRDDQIFCSVMVKDVDFTWPGYVNPLFDSQYRNSSILTIEGNANPGLTNDWNDANSTETAVAVGGLLNISVSWIDEDDDQVRLMVCEDFMTGEEQYDDGDDNISFGNLSTVWFYTTETGMIVNTISIKPFAWDGTGNTTNHTYDIYAYEMDAIGSITPGILLGKINDAAFTIGKYNTFKPEFSVGAYPDKYIGFKICIDDDNDEDCENGGAGVYVYANITGGTYVALEVNSTGNTTYYDPEIKINYNRTEGCEGTTYCNTELTSDNPVTCSYNTENLTYGNYTYRIRVYDPHGASSETRNRTFYVNRFPVIEWVNITPLYPLTNETINCSFSAYDPDGHSLTNQTVWYYRNISGVWNYYGSADHINPSRTTPGQYWKCEAVITDEYGLTSRQNSSVAYVVETFINDTIPFIINITTNGPSSPVNVEEDLTFEVNWEMINRTGDEMIVFYACSSPDMDMGGCSEEAFYQSPPGGEVLSDPFNVSYTVKSADDTNQIFYSRIYHNEDCSWLYNGSFYVNHMPTAQNVQISPQNANPSTTMQCSYDYNSSDTGIDDDENEPAVLYRWYINGSELTGQTGESLSYNFGFGDMVSCAVKVTDMNGLSDDEFVNSTNNVTIRDVPGMPIIWPLPDLVGVGYINIIGYTNDDNVTNVTVQTLDMDNNPKTNVTTDFEWAVKLGENVIVENTPAGKSYVKINDTSHETFNSSTYLWATNQNRDYFLLYNITGKVKIEGVNYDFYKLNITPSLEEKVFIGVVVFSYNSTYPNGWFNLTLPLWEGENTISVRAKNLIGSGTVYQDFIYYDNEVPVFNLSLIPNGSTSETNLLDFDMSDDYALDIDTLLLNISNGTDSLYYSYNSSRFSLDMEGNMTCFAARGIAENMENITVTVGDTNYTISPYFNGSLVVFQIQYDSTNEITGLLGEGDSYVMGDGNVLIVADISDTVTFYINSDIMKQSFCFVNTTLERGNYNLTFTINDTIGNEGSATKQFIMNDSIYPAPAMDIGDNVVHTTQLFMSWTPASIYSLQYTVGEKPYPQEGWNSTTDGWVNATEDEINQGNLTTESLDLVDDETYYFNVRYRKYYWTYWSSIGISESIKYIEFHQPAEPPIAVEVTTPREVHNEQILQANWTESQASPGYSIVYYEYAVGTAKYPDAGWNTTTDGWVNNILNRTVYREFNLTNRETYYFNVRVWDDGGLSSNISPSGPTTYYNQIAPTATVIGVENDTDEYDGWLDDIDNNYTNVSIQGNRNITCHYSEYDRHYIDMEYYGDDKCNESGEWGINLTCQIPDLSEGNYYNYYIACKDSDGRMQNRTENTEVSFDLDFSPPTITFIYPEERNFTNRTGKFGVNDSFLFNVTDSPAGVGEVNYTIYNSTGTLDSGNLSISPDDSYSYTWANEDFTDGNYSMTIESRDNYGHYSNYTRNFTLDKIPPNITPDIYGQVNGSYFHESFNITTNILDYLNASYLVLGTDLNETNNSVGYGNDVNWTSLIDVTDLDDGLYTIEYTAVDSVDNSKTESVQFYVDKHAWFNSSNPIDNQTWTEDTSLTDVIDLDNYFIGIDNVNVSYSYSGTENITVDIPEREEVELSDWNTSGEAGTGDVVIQFFGTSVTLKNANGTFYQNVTANSSTNYMLAAEHKATDTDDFQYTVRFEGYNGANLVELQETQFTASTNWDSISFNYTTGSTVDIVKIKLKQNYLTQNVTTTSEWRNIKLYVYYDHAHMVSFTPEANWNGTEYVTFYASDSYGVMQPSNLVKLTVADDYCNPPASGEWVLDQTEVAQCTPNDQTLLDNLGNINITTNTTLNITNLSLKCPLYFKDTSTGYSRNSIFYQLVHLSDNSSLTAWNVTFYSIQLIDNATLIVYDSPGTIIILDVNGNQNLILENENIGTASFKKTSGEITNSTINSSTFYINGTGKISDMNEVATSGYINTTNMKLNFTNVQIDNIYVYGLSDSDITVEASSFTFLNTERNITLQDSNISTLELEDGSVMVSNNSVIGNLTSAGNSKIYGNLTLQEAQVTSGEAERHYPLYVYSNLGTPLSDVNVTLSGTSFTSNGFVTTNATFNSSNYGDEFVLYTDGLNLQNITLTDYTPLNITSFLLDPDGDGNPISNDTDDDNDGILDVDDTLTGNAFWVGGNAANLNISINDSYNLSQLFSGTLHVNVTDDEGMITEFDWTFTNDSKLELQYWEINRGFTNGRQWITISGLHLPGAGTKTVYLNQTNESLNAICVYDHDITDISVISDGCSSPLETYLQCPGSSGNYGCSVTGCTLNVTGLSYSGVIQNSATTSTTTTTTIIGGGGGSSGGGGTSAFTIDVSDNKVEISGLRLSKDKSLSIDLEDWNGMVYKMALWASQIISDAKITIERLGPLQVWEVPRLSKENWKVYHYLKLDTEKLEDKTNSVTLYFSVEKNWIEENSINTVSLWRYGSGWKKIDTEKVGETSSRINYKSTFSGFSHFAVAGKVSVSVAETKPTKPEEEETVCGNGICEFGEEETCPSDCKPAITTGPGWFILPVLIAIVAVLVVFFYFKEKKAKKKPKIVRLPPPPKPIVKIKEIVSSPEKYIGKKVMIEGDITTSEFLPDENRVLYTIKDSTGEMEGLSRRAGHKGKGTIEGIVRKKKRRLYIEF